MVEMGVICIGYLDYFIFICVFIIVFCYGFCGKCYGDVYRDFLCSGLVLYNIQYIYYFFSNILVFVVFCSNCFYLCKDFKIDLIE